MAEKRPFIVAAALLLCLCSLTAHLAAECLDLSTALSSASARESAAETDLVELDDTEGDDVLLLSGKVFALRASVLLTSGFDRTLNSPSLYLSCLLPPPKLG